MYSLSPLNLINPQRRFSMLIPHLLWLTLTMSLLLTACTTTSNINLKANQLYSFPTGIEDGYWAMVGNIDGEYAVVDFNGNTSHNYRFKCDEATHTYRQIDKETYTLKPTVNSMQLVYEDKPAFATLKVVRLAPKQVLILQQSFPNTELQEALPDGIEFAYIYTTELKPLCGS